METLIWMFKQWAGYDPQAGLLIPTLYADAYATTTQLRETNRASNESTFSIHNRLDYTSDR